MLYFFMSAFVIITLFVRVPARVILKCTKKDIWALVDLVGMAAASLCFAVASAVPFAQRM